jgi:large repetitive protein
MRVRASRGDRSAPQLQQTTPADNATDVAVNANLILTFNEAVKAGTGSIVIRNANGSLVQSIDITDPSKVSFAGNQLIINPGNDLSPDTSYYVTFASGVVRDLANNAFAGISSAAVFSFTTEESYVDTTAPIILFTSPDGFITGGQNIVITFNEPVRAGSGAIHIRNAADDSLLLTISVNDTTQVLFSGRNAIINPMNDLPPGNYYLAMAPNAFEDLYDNTIDDTALAAIEALGVVAVACPFATSYGAFASAVNGGVVVVASATSSWASAYAVGITQHASASANASAIAIGMDPDGYGAPEDLIAGNDASLDVSAFSLAAAAAGDVLSATSNQVDVLGADGLTYRFFGSNISTFSAANHNRLAGGDITLIEVWAGFGESAHILYSHYVDDDGLGSFLLADFDIGDRLRGDSTLIGSSEDDALFGFAGDDVLIGRAGDDDIDGGTGDDEIWGNAGGDSLEGESGFDTFKFASFADLDGDVIVDFEGGDRVDLSAIAGLSFIGPAAFTGVAGQARYAWVPGNTVLQIDSDGDGVSNASLLLGGGQVSLGETLPGSRVLVLTNDVIAPLLVSTSPADNAVNVTEELFNITMTFNENVKAGTGLIEIRLSSDNSLVGTVNVADSVNFDGRKAWFQFDGAIDPTTGYYITFAPGVIKDLAGNNFAGLSSSTAFNFTSGDFIAPRLVSTTPTDDASGVAINANIVLTFDEAVVPVAGSISINRSSDATHVATFSVVGDSRVTFSGNTVTLDPNVDLAPGESYYVQVYPGRIADLSGNLYAGLSQPYQLNFTTANNPGLVLTGTGLSNTLVGGAGSDTITGLGGKDTLTGAAGSDAFVYGAVSHSTSRNYDTITDLDGSSDVLDLWFQVTGVDASITGGSIGSRRFDSDLASAVNSTKLAAHHAVLFTPSSGVPAGSKFLIVDANGVAGYQAGADLVILLGANSTNLGSLTTSDFV